MKEILGLELAELAREIGGPSYRTSQVLKWIYSKLVTDFQKMTNLPAHVRADLASKFSITLPEVVASQVSADGTTKYALKAGDEIIETVHMPEEKRDTICISSQAGC